MPNWLNAEDPWLVKGMRASTDIARAEHELTVATAKAIRAFLDLARKGVLNEPFTTADKALVAAEMPPNLGGWPPSQTWGELVEEFIITAVIKIWNRAFATGLDTFAATLDVTEDLLDDLFGRPTSTSLSVSPTVWRSQYVSTVRDRLSPDMWPMTAYEHIRGLIDDSLARGTGVDALNKELREALQITGKVNGSPIWEHETQRIARTETIGAYNAAGFNAAQAIEAETEETVFKQWFATRDTRTRISHWRAHGQVVAMREQFSVGGSQLMFPGDPTGPADEVIQCRCTPLYLGAEEAEDEKRRYLQRVAELDAEAT